MASAHEDLRRAGGDDRRAGGGGRAALAALTAAGVLWGLTVPLSKVSLEWLGPGWLTVARFAPAAPLLALAARRGLRGALTPGVVIAGALGYGMVILLQNAGIERTSVSHAALIVGAVPVLVGLIAAGLGRGTAGPAAWAGFVLALAGVGIVAGGGGGDASLAGDLIVLASVAGASAWIVAQPRLLAGRDPAAVTAVQLGAGALAALPFAVALEGAPNAPEAAGPALAALGLALAGTLLAFWLFAYGQSHVPADLAGAFVNLEPLVGAAAGAIAFHDPFGPVQVAGGLTILAGIALASAGSGSGEQLRGRRELEDHVRVRGRRRGRRDRVGVRPLDRGLGALDGHRLDAHRRHGLEVHGTRIGRRDDRREPADRARTDGLPSDR
jgi:O-acetylserine/cysteine efflux transporter